MKKTGFFPLFVLLLGLILLAGVLFRSFFLEVLIQPIALAIWWIVRICLSIDQKYYWGALLLMVVAFAVRQFSAGQPAEAPIQSPELNVYLESLKGWQDSIRLSGREGRSQDLLKGKVSELLVAAYRLQQPDSTSLEVYRALKGGELPLPETISAFLFPEDLEQEGRLFKRLRKTAWPVLKKWSRRLAGQEQAAYHRSLDETLAFIETFLESNHEPEWKH